MKHFLLSSQLLLLLLLSSSLGVPLQDDDGSAPLDANLSQTDPSSMADNAHSPIISSSSSSSDLIITDRINLLQHYLSSDPISSSFDIIEFVHRLFADLSPDQTVRLLHVVLAAADQAWLTERPEFAAALGRAVLARGLLPEALAFAAAQPSRFRLSDLFTDADTDADGDVAYHVACFVLFVIEISADPCNIRLWEEADQRLISDMIERGGLLDDADDRVRIVTALSAHGDAFLQAFVQDVFVRDNDGRPRRLNDDEKALIKEMSVRCQDPWQMRLSTLDDDKSSITAWIALYRDELFPPQIVDDDDIAPSWDEFQERLKAIPLGSVIPIHQRFFEESAYQTYCNQKRF